MNREDIEVSASAVCGLDGTIVGATEGLSGELRVPVKRHNIKSPGFRLTERDYDIFGFLLDQKFASIETLYFRFFDARANSSDPMPENLYVARQRLGILKRAGLISSERVYSDPKSLFLLTPLGYHQFKMKRDEDAYAPPVTSVDFRNYEHDQALNYCRVALERQGKSMRWFSERRLRMHGFQIPEIRFELPDSIVPDAIFISSKGNRIAFEIEYTHRKKSRYQWKIDQYETVMGGANPLLHGVLFVGGTDRVYRDLKEVLPQRSKFVLESYAHFLGRLFPSNLATKVHKQLEPHQDVGLA